MAFDYVADDLGYERIRSGLQSEEARNASRHL